MTKTSGVPASATAPMVSPIAHMSCGLGTTGITTRSAIPKTEEITAPLAGGVSITTSRMPFFSNDANVSGNPRPSTLAQMGVSADLLFHQVLKPLIGSASMMATGPAPALSAATARCADRVVFPAPPLRLARTIVCTATRPLALKPAYHRSDKFDKTYCVSASPKATNGLAGTYLYRYVHSKSPL